jgi:N-acetyl-gamma-glutamyl-phosphate reductase
MTQSATKTVFIDGGAGTTGLGIQSRLEMIDGIRLVSLPDADRKNASAKADLMRDCDLVVLCLPDDAARETVAIADELPGGGPVIVDASTAHRVADGWVYGFAELCQSQCDAIRNARRIANPGCYPTGGIALLRPLVDAGALRADAPISVNAVSGYSGGGKQMIAAYEAGEAPPFELYGLGLAHKHLPELQHYSGLSRTPIFVPSVGNFRQGMLVSVPVHTDMLTPGTKIDDIETALAGHYDGLDIVGGRQVQVVRQSEDQETTGGRISAVTLNDTDQLELRVFANADKGQAVLVARLDNLGKGASGAAVQNIGLALGLL